MERKKVEGVNIDHINIVNMMIMRGMWLHWPQPFVMEI